MSMYRSSKCSENTICAQMDMRLKDARFKNVSGFQIVEKIDIGEEKVLKRKLAVVVYKKTPKDKPMQINICPWCEGRPGILNTSGDGK